MKHWSDETNWLPLRAAVVALKAQAEAAYRAGKDDEAGAAHDDLTAAEWRMRQAGKQEK